MSDSARIDLKAKARVICSNWEKVIAESVFKYAGSVYSDLEELKANPGDEKLMRTHAKHWGELKGFALSLHTSGQNLGELGTRIDRLIGLGPVVDGSAVTGVDGGGNYFEMSDADADKYMVHMLKLQKLMEDEFGVSAKNNDKLAGISNISEVLGSGDSAEND